MEAEGREFITPEEAEAMLPDGDTIHTFRNRGPVLVGADWDRAAIIAAIQKFKPELTGPQAREMHHGLAIEDHHGMLFIETRKESVLQGVK